MAETESLESRLGDVLRQARLNRGWTISTLARRSGTARRTIRNAEAGGPGRLHTLHRLATAMDTTVSDLVRAAESDRGPTTAHEPPEDRR